MKKYFPLIVLFLFLCGMSCGRKPQWLLGLESRCYSDLITDGDLVFVPTQVGEMIAANYKTGKVQWKTKVKGSFFGAPAVTNTNLYALTQQGDLYSWNKKDGSVSWKKHFADQFAGSVSASDDFLFFASATGVVYCVSPQDGSTRWTHTGDIEFISKPVVSGNYVFIGGWSSKLYCFTTDGAVNWTFKTGYVIVQDAVVENNVVYFSSHDNYVYAADLQSGKLIWRFSAFEPRNLALLSDGVAFADRHGILYLVQKRNGTLQQKVNLKHEVSHIYEWNGKCLIITNTLLVYDPNKRTVQKLLSGRNPFYKLAVADSMFIISDDLYTIYGFPAENK